MDTSRNIIQEYLSWYCKLIKKLKIFKLQAASLDLKHKLPHLTIPVALDPMAGGAPADSARDQWHLKILTNDFSNILRIFGSLSSSF